MDYKKIYDDIILKAKSYNRQKSNLNYFENHHIIPKSCGGDKIKNNKVLLTAKEHYVCHHILIKLFEKGTIERRNMIFAFRTFFLLNNDLMHRYCCAKDYEFIKHEYQYLFNECRKNWSKSLSKEEYDSWRLKISIGLKKNFLLNGHPWVGKVHLKETKIKIGNSSAIHQRGKGNSQFGKKWFTNYETGESHSFFEKPNIKWVEGRNLFRGEFKKLQFKFIKNNIYNNLKTKNIRYEYALELFNIYKSSDCKSLREFCRKGFYKKSHVSLTKLFTLIPEFNEKRIQGKSFK